ncbi:SAM-dependent methyltransferase [Candidatus Marinamargulisbacteria bacterium SCGC AAA071-K20]|nr:SAM-dependent methyltransferase [Candidatus Marinamargulisbacteria bacterium SCGC AAA071-K20]
MTQLKLITTADQSSSLLNQELNETYHSRHGALQESEHVFIKYGLNYFSEKALQSVDILEIGFGTGLNTLLTFVKKKDTQSINYTTLEPFPISLDIAKQLNYCSQLKLPEKTLLQFHRLSPNLEHKLGDTFTFKKIISSIEPPYPKNTTWIHKKYTLIYYDAFGPRAQEKMWTESCFRLAYSLLKPGGILVTFCAKGEVKRHLKTCGFTVETLPGPPGKREMTRAIKNE